MVKTWEVTLELRLEGSEGVNLGILEGSKGIASAKSLRSPNNERKGRERWGGQRGKEERSSVGLGRLLRLLWLLHWVYQEATEVIEQKIKLWSDISFRCNFLADVLRKRMRIDKNVSRETIEEVNLLVGRRGDGGI